MFCRYVVGNISGGFRGISRFFGNFAGFRGNTWISRVRDRAKYQKPCKKNQAVFKLFNIIVYITKQYPYPRPGSSNDGYKFNPGLSQRNFKQGFLVYQKTCNSDKLLENTIEPLIWDTVMISQNVTLSNT